MVSAFVWPVTGDNALGSPPNYRLRAPTARKRTNREPATVGPTSNQKRQADLELNKTRFHRQVGPTCFSDVWFWASNSFWAPGVPRDWVGACGSPHLTKGIQIQTLRSILLEPASVASRGGRFGQVATFVVWFRPEGPGESRKIRGGQAVPLRQGGSLRISFGKRDPKTVRIRSYRRAAFPDAGPWTLYCICGRPFFTEQRPLPCPPDWLPRLFTSLSGALEFPSSERHRVEVSQSVNVLGRFGQITWVHSGFKIGRAGKSPNLPLGRIYQADCLSAGGLSHSSSVMGT